MLSMHLALTKVTLGHMTELPTMMMKRCQLDFSCFLLHWLSWRQQDRNGCRAYGKTGEISSCRLCLRYCHTDHDLEVYDPHRHCPRFMEEIVRRAWSGNFCSFRHCNHSLDDLPEYSGVQP